MSENSLTVSPYSRTDIFSGATLTEIRLIFTESKRLSQIEISSSHIGGKTEDLLLAGVAL